MHALHGEFKMTAMPNGISGWINNPNQKKAQVWLPGPTERGAPTSILLGRSPVPPMGDQRKLLEVAHNCAPPAKIAAPK